MSMDPQHPQGYPPPGSPPTGYPPPGSPPTGYPPPGSPQQRVPMPGPNGIPPGWPNRRQRRGNRPEQSRLDPGPFRWMDLITVLAYIGLLLFGLAALILFVPGLLDGLGLSPTDPATLFFINAITYSLLAVLALVSCWRPFIESFRTFRTYGVLKAVLIPMIWFGCIMINALLLLTIGEPVRSENQLAIEGMTQSVPFLPVFIVLVLCGPFVEEYIFRHLMIGKLSRHLNIWVCAVLSIITFALLHFVGTGFSFNPAELIPYVTLGVAITVSYILTGRSMAYAYLLHVFNNGIAILVIYTLLPAMEGAA